jgi:hypothetical protein
MEHQQLFGSKWRNYFAKFGFEVIVIVAGILLALAISDWDESRKARALEQQYLERLIADVEANLFEAEKHATWHGHIVENARLVFPLITYGTTTDYDDVSIVAQAYNATALPVPAWTTTTYLELLSTGRLVLITNTVLRNTLSEYYLSLEANDYPLELASNAYRSAIRSRFDPELQLRIRGQCARNKTSCSIDGVAESAGEMIDWMTGNVELSMAITRVIIQSTRAETEYFPYTIDWSEHVLEMLRTELATSTGR